jgi:stage V sporulation protein G
MAQVTDVRIYNMEGTGNLKAYATVTLDESYVVHGIKVLEGDAGLWVSMPASKNKKGEYKDVFHPITKEARENLVSAVIEAYETSAAGGSEASDE